MARFSHVWYLRANTKFYRAMVVTMDDGTAYSVFNWGKGKLVSDPEWKLGGLVVKFHQDRNAAEKYALKRIDTKINKPEYSYGTATSGVVTPKEGAVPTRVWLNISRYTSTSASTKEPEIKAAAFSLHDENGNLKPAARLLMSKRR